MSGRGPIGRRWRYALVCLLACLAFGCANGGTADYYQRGPTKHWDSFPANVPHGPGYYTYGRPPLGRYGRY